MSGVLEIKNLSLALGYFMLIIPLSIALIYGVKLFKDLTISIIRMTLQLLFVGFYLHFVFELNNWALTLLWLLVMVVVADVSIARNSKLPVKPFFLPLFIALLIGTLIPLLYFIGVIVRVPYLFEAQYFIPISGMIMGNCLRANIIGISDFYNSLRENEKAYLNTLAMGASLKEGLLPYLQNAVYASLAPTIATMATVGLVSLPGMMTGIILGGTNPMTAIKYQIAIMLAIFVGTAITVFLGIRLTISRSFTNFGVLDRNLFKKS